MCAQAGRSSRQRRRWDAARQRQERIKKGVWSFASITCTRSCWRTNWIQSNQFLHYASLGVARARTRNSSRAAAVAPVSRRRRRARKWRNPRGHVLQFNFVTRFPLVYVHIIFFLCVGRRSKRFPSALGAALIAHGSENNSGKWYELHKNPFYIMPLHESWRDNKTHLPAIWSSQNRPTAYSRTVLYVCGLDVMRAGLRKSLVHYWFLCYLLETRCYSFRSGVTIFHWNCCLGSTQPLSRSGN